MGEPQRTREGGAQRRREGGAQLLRLESSTGELLGTVELTGPDTLRLRTCSPILVEHVGAELVLTPMEGSEAQGTTAIRGPGLRVNIEALIEELIQDQRRPA